VIETLESNRVAVRPRIAGPGLSAEVGTDGPLVGFRADLDQLPILELANVAYRSTVDGVMHACGHDAHTAIGTYAAVLLRRLGIDMGRVRFVFQPAEEVFPGGAIEIVRDGIIDGIEAMMAFHVDPSIPAGTVGLRPGTITGSSDRFEIYVEGPGGHTARPHDTVNTIDVASQIVTQVPQRLAAQIDARSPVTLVFGRISGGQADNVIPASVEMSGTCRTLSR
jgi:amidohydrolase